MFTYDINDKTLVVFDDLIIDIVISIKHYLIIDTIAIIIDISTIHCVSADGYLINIFI